MLDDFRSTLITWDKATSRIYSPVTANASDENGRKLVVQIVNGGQVEDLTGATLHLYWQTRDKAHDGLDVFKAVDLEKGEFELSYTTGMLSNHGVLNANLVLVDTIGRVVSERFKITVTEGIDNDAIQSENSFTTLTQALIDISNLEQNYAPRLNDLTAQLQQTEQELSLQLAQTPTKEYVNEKVQGVSLAFKESFNTVNDLQTAYPSGNIHNHVVLADGMIYTYANNSWKNTGIKANGTGLAKGTVTWDKLESDIVENLDNKVKAIDKEGERFLYVNNERSDVETIENYDFTATADRYFAYDDVNDYYVTNARANASYEEPISQTLDNMKVGKKYNLLIDLKKDNVDFTNNISILVHDSNDNLISKFDILHGDINMNTFKSFSFQYIPTTPEIKVYIYLWSTSSNYRFNFKNYKHQLIETVGSDEILYTESAQGIILNNTLYPFGEGGGEFKKTVYVSLTGDDDNTGLSFSNAYATLQRALDSGASQIYVERGVYHNQTATKTVDEVTILPYNDLPYSASARDVQLIEFRGSDTLDNNSWINHNAIFKQTYAGNDYFQQVFIDKSLPVVRNADRGIYNANVWEGNDKESDTRLKPVLTLAECEAEESTFFYDGTDLYVNPTNGEIGEKEYNVPKLSLGLDLTGGKVVLHDVKFDFYFGDQINLDKVKSVYVQNSEAGHSSAKDGFSVDYTNGKFVDCKAYKNAIDGFNLHFYGDTEFVNCDGINNYDDGISHHEGCTGVIIGGKWRGNGKGGISPASGAKVNWYNAVMEDNLYGAYHSNIEGVESVSSGNLYLNNGRAIANNNAVVISMNDTFSGNEIDTIGSGETIVY